MKWNELKRLAISKGWYLIRNGKKHDIYAHPDTQTRIEMGRHGTEDIPSGTFNKLKKQIGF